MYVVTELLCTSATHNYSMYEMPCTEVPSMFPHFPPIQLNRTHSHIQNRYFCVCYRAMENSIEEREEANNLICGYGT